MGGQAFQIEHLGAARLQMQQQAGLARSGQAAHHAVTQALGQRGDLGQDRVAERLVPARQLSCVPADLAQYVRDRRTALSATPAVQQRTPLTGMFAQRPLEMACDVGCDEGGADLARSKGRNLLVERADVGAFCVGEDRQIACAGNAIECEFRRRTHVDQRIEFGQLCNGGPVAGQGLCAHVIGRFVSRNSVAHLRGGAAAAQRSLPSIGPNCAHTVSSIIGCASAPGWMPSPWNSERRSAKPSSRKGTKRTFSARATST